MLTEDIILTILKFLQSYQRLAKHLSIDLDGDWSSEDTASDISDIDDEEEWNKLISQ